MQTSPDLGTYFASFGDPLTVSTIAKISMWPNLQTMGHDASLKDLIKNFHGVKDALNQFNQYSLANPTVLASCFSAIAPLILPNATIAQLITIDPVLGPVGPSVEEIPNMGAVFSTSADQLKTGSQAVGALMSS